MGVEVYGENNTISPLKFIMKIINLHDKITKSLKTSSKIDDEKFVLQINEKHFNFPLDFSLDQLDHGYLSPENGYMKSI